MSSLVAALPFVLKHEGGWSDDPDDPGGATNHGITLETAQKHGIHTKEALKAITADQVAEIYRTDYWRFGGITDQRVATKLFDMAVNMGSYAATKIVQRQLNDLGAGLAVDGIWGPLTEKCVNALTPDHMLTLLCMGSEGHYLDIVGLHPERGKFLSGWLRRAGDVPC